MFIIRPKPLPFESLSSWRQRAGLANGFRRFPRPAGFSYRTDPDRLPNEIEMRWLEEELLIDAETIRGTTLEYAGRHLERGFGSKSRLRWVIPTVDRNSENLGPVCCPRCLAEDEVPHFRIHWRFVFIGTCPVHGTALIGQCPHCGTSLWPANVRRLPDDVWLDFQRCPFCDNSLSAGVEDRVDEYSGPLWECAQTGAIPVEFGQAADSFEVFAGLHSFCQLLLRGTSRHVWRVIPFEGDIPSFLTDEDRHVSEIEGLRMNERARVLRAGYWLMQDWPARFLAVASETGLSRQHFTATRSSNPRWLTEQVNGTIARKRIGITKDDVRRTVTSIRASGGKVSKLAVRKALGVSESAAINDLMSQRRKATTSELLMLCGKFERGLATVPKSRDQQATWLRDYLVFLLSVLTEQSIESVCAMTEAEVRLTLSKVISPTDFSDAVTQQIVVRGNQLNGIYGAEVRGALADGVDDSAAWFVARGGANLAGHSIRERIAKMMQKGFPSSLWCSADVFRISLRKMV